MPLLNNLGHWLGMITLAKNKPIMLDDIKLELLLIEAYNGGDKELKFTVPFVARVLESCVESRVRSMLTLSINSISDNSCIRYYSTTFFFIRYLNRKILGQCR